MKTNHIIFPIIVSLAVLFFSIQTSENGRFENYLGKSLHKSSNGSKFNKTGAPGELNCTQCHAGTVMAGANQNLLQVFDGGTEVFSYVPGNTYKVSLSLASGSVSEGFSATALLNSNDNAAGSFPGSGLAGTQINSGGGRFYASHTSSSNVLWEWDWTAPSTDLGAVTFYVATNKGNANGTATGDQIFLSQHVFNSTVGIDEVDNTSLNFKAFYDQTSSELKLSFSSLNKENIFVSVLGVNGNMIYSKQIGISDVGENKFSVAPQKSISPGIYFVQLFVGNKGVTQKIRL